jgi:hypothetical protein
MATPTITDISPVTGPAAGGQLITITGTNFKEPTLVYDIPTPDDITPTVAVTIGGIAARAARVISDTEVRVLTPRFWHQDPRVSAFSAVDVVLSNLDSAGDVIVGETVTETEGFTYKRWELGAPRRDPPITRITKELLWALAIEVESNTYRGTHVDFGEEGTAVTIDEAELPSVNVTMSFPPDPEFGARDNYPEEVDKGDGTYDLYEGGKTLMLVADMLVAGGTTGEAEMLCQSILDFAMVNPLLLCSADPVLFPGETDEYPLEITGYPQQIGSPTNSGMVLFNMQLTVRGVMTLPDDPTLNAKPITYATLTTQYLNPDGTGSGSPSHSELL